MSRFGRTSGILIRSGIPLLQILDLVAESVGNFVIAKAIDDIKTSGATLNECAKTLKQAGASKVFALVLAVAGQKSG